MKQRIVVRRLASADLIAAAHWYEKQRAGLREEFLAVMYAAFQHIESSPKTYPIVHGHVRRAMVSRFPYVVFFTVESKQIVVLRVLHAARNPRLWPR